MYNLSIIVRGCSEAEYEDGCRLEGCVITFAYVHFTYGDSVQVTGGDQKAMTLTLAEMCLCI